MAEAQEQIENEDDDIANKSAEIGEIIGVEKDKDGKEILPDYEVIEDDDERIAKEKTPTSRTSRKELTTKEKRDAKKRRIQEGYNSRDAIIARQQDELRALSTWKNQVEGRLTNVDKQKVEEYLNNSIHAYNAAKLDHKAAFAEGDADKATAAMEQMYAANEQIKQWQATKQQYAAATIAPKQPANNQPDSRIMAKKEAFEQRHSDWYNPEGGDEDSEIAKGISNVLIKQGLNPASDEFWDELDTRLEERGIIGEEEPVKPVARKRAAPPVGGGNSRADVAGKVKVNLPSQYVQYCKDIGKWDDPKDKARMISRYIATQKANEA